MKQLVENDSAVLVILKMKNFCHTYLLALRLPTKLIADDFYRKVMSSGGIVDKQFKKTASRIKKKKKEKHVFKL